jgi:hypothetical protein
MADFGLKNDEPSPAKPHVAPDLLASIKPRSAPRPSINVAESDRLAATAGFTSREPSHLAVDPREIYGTPRRAKREPEPMTPLSMKLRRSLHKRFRDFADERKLSYPEALEKLLNDSEILERLERKE